MSTSNSYATSTESERIAENKMPDPVGVGDSAGNKLARSFWLSYSLIATGVVGAIAIGLILWGDRADNINLIWAGSILFAVVLLVWLILVSILTWWVASDLVRTISGLLRRRQIPNRIGVDEPHNEQNSRR